jgi:hypothetical protein
VTATPSSAAPSATPSAAGAGTGGASKKAPSGRFKPQTLDVPGSVHVIVRVLPREAVVNMFSKQLIEEFSERKDGRVSYEDVEVYTMSLVLA